MSSILNSNSAYMPNYENWLKKDIWILEDAVCLLLNVEPLKRESRIYRNRKFKILYSDILDTVEKAIDRTLTIETNAYTSFDHRGVKPDVFIKWAKKKKYEIPPPLQHLLDETDEAEKPTDQYSNLNAAPKLLKDAVDAWARVWVVEELGNNPLQKTIMPWLVKKYKVSKNEAIAIDKIIRTKKRKKGALNK